MSVKKIKISNVHNIAKLFLNANFAESKEKYKDAENFYTKVISLDRTNIKAYNKLALVLLEMQNVEEARKIMKTAVNFLMFQKSS